MQHPASPGAAGGPRSGKGDIANRLDRLHSQDTAPAQGSLDAIAARIRNRVRGLSESIIGIGLDLIEAKKLVGHGAFGAWLAEHVAMSERSAQNYMRAAAAFGAKSAIVADLEPSEVYRLSSKSVPDEIRADLIAKAEAGQPIDREEIGKALGKVMLAKQQAFIDARTKRRPPCRAASSPPKQTTSFISPASRCLATVRRLILDAMAGMTAEDAASLIAEFREEIDDLEKVAARRAQEGGAA